MAEVELATPQDKFMTYEIDLEFNSKTVVLPLDVVDAKLIFTFSQGWWRTKRGLESSNCFPVHFIPPYIIVTLLGLETGWSIERIIRLQSFVFTGVVVHSELFFIKYEENIPSWFFRKKEMCSKSTYLTKWVPNFYKCFDIIAQDNQMKIEILTHCLLLWNVFNHFSQNKYDYLFFKETNLNILKYIWQPVFFLF